MSRYVQSNVLEQEDVHTLAALLKLYLRLFDQNNSTGYENNSPHSDPFSFRELPEPLFSFEMYEKIMEAKGNIKRKALLKQMSNSHYAVLESVMMMAREVALNQEVCYLFFLSSLLVFYLFPLDFSENQNGIIQPCSRFLSQPLPTT